jgi:hypothetical protein
VRVDLHKGNIAFEIPDLDGKREDEVIDILGVPIEFVPVLTRNPEHQTASLPKYLVIPGTLMDLVERGNMQVKIVDLGEGSLFRS